MNEIKMRRWGFLPVDIGPTEKREEYSADSVAEFEDQVLFKNFDRVINFIVNRLSDSQHDILRHLIEERKLSTEQRSLSHWESSPFVDKVAVDREGNLLITVKRWEESFLDYEFLNSDYELLYGSSDIDTLREGRWRNYFHINKTILTP